MTGKTKATIKVGTTPGKREKQNKEHEKLMAQAAENPYMTALYKRLRSSRKKLEKIKSLETAVKEDGKVLNEQQQELVQNKPHLEKMVTEYQALREQFFDIFKQEQAKETQEEQSQTAESSPAPSLTPEDNVEQSDEHNDGMSTKSEDEPAHPMEGVEAILKVLHTVNLCHAIGDDVPTVLDFFCKLILGNTRPPAELSFFSNLDESIEEARKYLASSDEILACETTYSGLEDMIEDMIESHIGSPEAIDEAPPVSMPVSIPDTEDIEAAIIGGQAPGVAPELNFFTESTIEDTYEMTAEERALAQQYEKSEQELEQVEKQLTRLSSKLSEISTDADGKEKGQVAKKKTRGRKRGKKDAVGA